MKKTIVAFALLVGGLVFETASAQVHVSLNVNIGVQPVWGPVGYDHVEYYYMPDIDAYYSVPRHQYVYLEGGRWIFAQGLPPRFRNYDVYSGYKVVVNERAPYRHAQMYRTKYASFRGHHDQPIIRNSHEQKYFENKDHPEHDKWKGGHDGPGNNGRGHANGHHRD